MPFDATPITSPAIEALREGRARVALGWCQNQLLHVDPDTHHISVCAVGALDTGASPLALATLARALHVNSSAPYIKAWNDSPSRTQADVLALYDRAIDMAVAEALAK